MLNALMVYTMPMAVCIQVIMTLYFLVIRIIENISRTHNLFLGPTKVNEISTKEPKYINISYYVGRVSPLLGAVPQRRNFTTSRQSGISTAKIAVTFEPIMRFKTSYGFRMP